jgi:predicted peptidase
MRYLTPLVVSSLLLGLTIGCSSTGSQLAAPDIQEHMLQPGDRRYTIAVPDGYTGEQPVPLVLALHFAGQVTPYFGRRLLTVLVEPGLRDLGAIIVAPDCNHGSWTDPRSEQDVLDLLDHVQDAYNIDPAKVLLTGYSLGGIGTWHLAAGHQDRFTAALVMSGRPVETAVNSEWKIPLYVIHSRLDELLPLAQTEAAVQRMQAAGANVELVVVEGLTHYETRRFQRPLRAAIPWIEVAWSSR